MRTKSRLLGLAFASADALFELDETGMIAFCAGAGPDSSTPLGAWLGDRLDAHLDPACAGDLAALLSGLPAGVRSPPAMVRLFCSDGRVRRAVLHAFRLPDLAPAVSCSLTWQGEPFLADMTEVAALATPAEFLDRAREVLSLADRGPIDLAFVDVPGLDGAPHAAGDRIHATLQSASFQGRSAAQLAPERFALLRGDSSDDLAKLVEAAAAAEGAQVAAAVSEVSLNCGGPPVNALRALRFTIESCLKEGGLADPRRAFGDHLKQTLREADRFSEMVRSREFELHWQPIVDLSTRAVHHFEGLARFGAAGAGPAPIIRMAEELGLVETFDLAVAEKAIGLLRRPGGGTLSVAVNMSALSLAGDGYVNGLLRMTQIDPALRKRLMVEVTETAALADLEAADRRLALLRAAGIRVCIDDFGAGAASFDWLGGLKVDMVKIDGGFVKRLETDPRASTLIAHLAALCASLRVDVVAEMIETEESAGLLRDLGVKFGQGWLFGRAEAEPVLRRLDAGLKRVGAVEAWG
jgi:EAL domain-containing protein (putative c-di-GMP-specific phosphodiesterase class I)